MRVESQVRVPVEQAQLINAGAFRLDTSEAQAVEHIGGVVGELIKREEINNDIAGNSKAKSIQEQAEIEYDTFISTNADTSKWNAELSKIKNRAVSQINSIKMSPEGRERLEQGTQIWGDSVTSIGNLGRLKQQGKDTMRAATATYQKALESGGEIDIIEAEDDLIEAVSTQFSPEVGEQYIHNIKGQSLIFKHLTIAGENPTPENIAIAEDTIETYSEDAKDRFYNKQRLRSMMSQGTQVKNATFKASIENQSQDMGKVFSSGLLSQADVLPELEVVRSQLTERYTNQTLDASDGQTFDFMSDKINTGTLFDQDDLTSAYATGMSSDEYKQIVELNEANAKLTTDQRSVLNDFGIDIDTRYRDILSTARASATSATAPDMMSAIHRDKKVMKSTVRKMVSENKTSTEIYEVIEANFISDTDRFYTKFWSTDFGLPEPVKGVTKREERFDAIMDLLKSGEEKDIKQLEKIIKFWYE